MQRTFRKKPVEIEAMQWDGTADGATAIIDWILASGATASYVCSDPVRCSENDGDTPHSISIRTLEGTMRAGLRDWIIRGVQGEFYPCKPDIFEATYEPVDDSAPEAASRAEDVYANLAAAKPGDLFAFDQPDGQRVAVVVARFHEPVIPTT